jgi:hypothetical protein
VAYPFVVRRGLKTGGYKGGREDANHRNPEDIEGAFVVEAAEVEGEP